MLPWAVHENVCERVPMLALARGAGWRLGASTAAEDSYHESELGTRATCWTRGELDYQARTTPIDGGLLSVDLYAANGREGLPRVAELYALEGPHAEVFALLGRPVRTSEEVIEGWWTDGFVKVYSQVGIPGSPAAVRAVARAQVTDGNLTVVVTTSAYVRGHSPRSIDRLEQLTLDTVAATHGALDARDRG